jgi:hypothetical protein
VAAINDLELGKVFLVNTVDQYGDVVYKFLHLTIQEFLAAYYIGTEPILSETLDRRKHGLDFF